MTRRQYRDTISERRRERLIRACLMMAPGLIVWAFTMFAIAQR